MIMKKLTALITFLMVFVVFISNASYVWSTPSATSSSSFDVSIDRVKLNDEVVVESRTNLINDADAFNALVDITAVRNLTNGHVEVSLRGRATGDSVADSTGTFNLSQGSQSQLNLSLILLDRMKRETEFDLRVKVEDAESRSETNNYRIKTESGRISGRGLDVSIDRVFVNSKVVSSSSTNFIDESDDFDVLVEFTALEDMEDAHVEAILRDKRTGTVVADSSPNFDLADGTSSSKLLRLELLDSLKQSDSFELTIKIIDAEDDSVQKLFGLSMEDGAVNGGRVLDISIDSVEVESEIVAENENNMVVIGEVKKDLDVRVRLTSLETIKDARVEAILTFENGDVVADATKTFDIGKDESAVKKLELPVVSKFERNNFQLRIKVADAEGDSEEKVYGLKLSDNKFPFIISTISLSPENKIEAGKHLGARLAFKNIGVAPLEGVTAKISIPELGVSSTKFIGQVVNSGQSFEIREDFVLKILDTVSTGTYTIRSEINSQSGRQTEIKEMPVFIIGKTDQKKTIINDKILIEVPLVSQNMFLDREVIYPITLTNEGPGANSYTLLLDGGGWADLRLAEPNVFIIKPKESKTINVYASSKATLGEHLFLATIKTGDKILSQIPLKGNIVTAAQDSLSSTLKSVLQVALIGFVIFLAAIASFFGIRRYIQRGNKEDISEEIPDEAEGEAYY